jgi:hypothetical protein
MKILRPNPQSRIPWTKLNNIMMKATGGQERNLEINYNAFM